MIDRVIFGDWGTSRLRLFLIESDRIAARLAGPGIAKAGRPPLELLQAALAPWRELGPLPPVVMCGMAGSRHGLIEVPYAPCPANGRDWAARHGLLHQGDLTISIAAGLACDGAAGPDVMRGEETQIFGALTLDAALSQGARTVILPGTHSKWVWLQDGVVTRFQTFPTGELFALLCDHSTLTHVNHGEMNHSGGGEAGFEAGLDRAAAAPGVLSGLFVARAAQLLRGQSRGWAVGYLSGLLIGAEVAEAIKAGPPQSPLLVIGEPALNVLYCRALARLQLDASASEGDRCAIAGLGLLHRTINAEDAR